MVFPTINAGEILQDVKQAISSPLGIGVATGAGVAILGASVVAVAKKRKKAKPKKRKTTKKRKACPRRRAKPKRKKRRLKYARTAGKGRDTSTRRIRMTKNGQPYVILASGKARFISRRSARLSRKRKGGRY